MGPLQHTRSATRVARADDLLAERRVGRDGLGSTVLRLLFAVAEHLTRRAGQAITTARILAGSPAAWATGLQRLTQQST